MLKGELLCACLLTVFCLCTAGFAVQVPAHTTQPPESGAHRIDAAAQADASHPEYEEGLSCNDCHEVNNRTHSVRLEKALKGHFLSGTPVPLW